MMEFIPVLIWASWLFVVAYAMGRRRERDRHEALWAAVKRIFKVNPEEFIECELAHYPGDCPWCGAE